MFGVTRELSRSKMAGKYRLHLGHTYVRLFSEQSGEKHKKEPIRGNRIQNEAIVDAYGPEQRSLGWYYYLENRLRSLSESRCIATRVISPLSKGKTVQVVAVEDACSIRYARADPMAWPDHGGAPVPTGRSQRGPINRRSHRQLALLGSAGLLFLTYARGPKTHDLSGMTGPATARACYVLRTNIVDWDAEQLWRTYIQLSDAEAAFRIHKSELSLRPIWHQRADRVQAHILVSFLAYVLWKTPEQWQSRARLGNSPRTILDELGRIQSTGRGLTTGRCPRPHPAHPLRGQAR